MKRWYWLGIVLFWFGAGAEAQTRYVSDILVITFRTGPGNEFNILRNLTSGARVEVLEESDDEVYSRVRLSDGAVGWVLTQYLQPEPTAGLRLAAATRELDDASQSSATFEGRAEELESELTQTRADLDEATARAERLDAELRDIRSASTEALATRDRNRSLSLEVADLTASVRDSQAEISELRSRNRQSWFIVGAAVLFGGIVIGLVAPSLRRGRRSNW